MEADFSGYATRNNLLCSDGRTIIADAFKENDGGRVPLVWQHRHDEATNVLGHAVLENRKDGVYAYGYFNDSPAADHARYMVKHGDITALSIYANNLVEKDKNVVHGVIRELSLVLSGANPGAFIENVNLKHGDASETAKDEAVIYTGLELSHSSDQSDQESDSSPEKSTTDSSEKKEAEVAEEKKDKTVREIFEGLTEEQKTVVYYLIGQALEADQDEAEKEEKEETEETEDDVKHESFDPSPLIHDAFAEGLENMRNVFDQNNQNSSGAENKLSHAQVQAIVNDAKKIGSFKDSFLAHAENYGFDKIDTLFPEAKTLSNSPEMIQRRTEWVVKVLDGTKHSPFSRIKSVVADITAEEARARGYVTGNKKKDEVIKLLKRATTPTTIYKKQKLDRDDIVDITDLDVVAWLKAEMRLMLDEEIARAILIGDGRSEASDDKIDESSIRPIASDDPMYAHQVRINNTTPVEDQIEALIRARSFYRGSGLPTFFTTLPYLTNMLLVKDKMGRRLYDSMDALANALMVKEIVTVEVMESDAEVAGIFVNLSDYTIGADKGGDISMFDDFDIDFNQHKYLIETRISGALTKPKSAIVVRYDAPVSVKPTAPSFNGETGVITFPKVDGVEYTIHGVPVTGSETITKSTDVVAKPLPGYKFEENATSSWNFTPTGA